MSYVTYTAAGPFTNSNPPGLNASFFNAIETFLSAGWFDSLITSNGSGIETVVGMIVGSGLLSLSSPHTQTINGSTSGTLTINEYMTGTGLKIISCYFSNYQNSGAAQAVTLNTAFTVGLVALNFGGNGLNFTVSGTTQTINVWTALGNGASSGSSTTATNNNLLKWSLGNCMAAVNGIREPGSNSTAATGFMLIAGY